MTKAQMKEVVLITCFYSKFDETVYIGMREDGDVGSCLSDETEAALIKLLKKEGL